MKWINNFNNLIVNKVNLENIDIKKHTRNTWIINDNNKEYLVIQRNLENDMHLSEYDKINHEKFDYNVRSNNDTTSVFSLEYGDKNSFIVDMNGIDNFLFAKSQVFEDYTIRRIVKKLDLLNDDEQYLRIGASGARENSEHPGGEVFEYSLLNGLNVDGMSQNVSGYLPQNECFSKSIPLYNPDKKTLREERIVYSHTAWLRRCDINESKCISIDIRAKLPKQSLLDILRDIANELNLKCYSMQICVKSLNNVDTEIKGRVLKHMPEKPFKDIPDIVDISYEKLFNLQSSETMYGMGTKYERYEPEWTEFTDGGIYERRGHIHATIIDKEKTQNNYKRHETFHLRDVFISPATKVQVVFNPINTVYRIYPIHKENEFYICDATKKPIDTVINNINLIDSKNKKD